MKFRSAWHICSWQIHTDSYSSLLWAHRYSIWLSLGSSYLSKTTKFYCSPNTAIEIPFQVPAAFRQSSPPSPFIKLEFRVILKYPAYIVIRAYWYRSFHLLPNFWNVHYFRTFFVDLLWIHLWTGFASGLSALSNVREKSWDVTGQAWDGGSCRTTATEPLLETCMSRCAPNPWQRGTEVGMNCFLAEQSAAHYLEAVVCRQVRNFAGLGFALP